MFIVGRNIKKYQLFKICTVILHLQFSQLLGIYMRIQCADTHDLAMFFFFFFFKKERKSGKFSAMEILQDKRHNRGVAIIS